MTLRYANRPQVPLEDASEAVRGASLVRRPLDKSDGTGTAMRYRHWTHGGATLTRLRSHGSRLSKRNVPASYNPETKL